MNGKRTYKLTICIYCKENRKYIKFFKSETNHFDDGENESDRDRGGYTWEGQTLKRNIIIVIYIYARRRAILGTIYIELYK